MDCRLRVAWLALLFVAFWPVPHAHKLHRRNSAAPSPMKAAGVCRESRSPRPTSTPAWSARFTSETGTYVMPALPTGLYKVKAELVGFAHRAEGRHPPGRGRVGDRSDFTLKVASVAGDDHRVRASRRSSIPSDRSFRTRVAEAGRRPAGQRPRLARTRVARSGGARQPGRRSRRVPRAATWRNIRSTAWTSRTSAVAVRTRATAWKTSKSSRCETNRFDAEYGRVNGAVINAVTKAGTNQVRAQPASGSSARTNSRSVHDAPSFFTGQMRRSSRSRPASTAAARSQEQGVLLRELRVPEARAQPRARTPGIPQFDVDLPADTTSSLHDGPRRLPDRTPHIGCSAALLDLQLEAAEHRHQRHDDRVRRVQPAIVQS